MHILETEMATHSSVLALRISGMGEPGGLPSMGSHSRTRLKGLSSSSSSAYIVIKEIEAPYMFDWENAIALDTMQGNQASSRREWKVSWVFSSCGRNPGYILEL